jgi:hypothetical protein
MRAGAQHHTLKNLIDKRPSKQNESGSRTKVTKHLHINLIDKRAEKSRATQVEAKVGIEFTLFPFLALLLATFIQHREKCGLAHIISSNAYSIQAQVLSSDWTDLVRSQSALGRPGDPSSNLNIMLTCFHNGNQYKRTSSNCNSEKWENSKPNLPLTNFIT